MAEFKKGEFGHIDLCYTKFVSMLSEQPSAIPVLPLKLNLHYNRARQASITQEITEIVGEGELLSRMRRKYLMPLFRSIWPV